jgi:phospholipid/cholesterol/gamma-HCH transport system permease protein
MKKSYFNSFDEDNNGTRIVLESDWVIDRSAEIRAELSHLPENNITLLDATGIDRMDMWGILQIQNLHERTSARVFLNEDQKKMFGLLSGDAFSLSTEPSQPYITQSFITLGKMASNAGKTIYGMITLIGEIAICFLRNFAHPKSFRFHSIIRHIEETGLRALPIIALLAVLISMVISYQAATQLQKFGASIFTVDLTVISILREMGVLITAIMVAGRSGSAFAAEIGVMKLREEIDALKTMGLNPVEILVLPRLIAMMITLPLLAFTADIVGLAGGGLISILLLDIPLDQYIDRVDMVAKPTMFFVGLIKAPVFAFIITIVGTYQGMNVSGSAESVGKLTTVSVVQSIFLVIMVDALFSIVFSNLGI